MNIPSHALRLALSRHDFPRGASARLGGSPLTRPDTLPDHNGTGAHCDSATQPGLSDGADSGKEWTAGEHSSECVGAIMMIGAIGAIWLATPSSEWFMTIAGPFVVLVGAAGAWCEFRSSQSPSIPADSASRAVGRQVEP